MTSDTTTNSNNSNASTSPSSLGELSIYDCYLNILKLDGDGNRQSYHPFYGNLQESVKPVRTGRMRSKNLTCLVCSDTAFGNHYGALVCNGCKGFFRRSIWSKRKYSCRFGNDCRIDKSTRNVCRACRLRHCFAKGMKPEAVQLEGERYIVNSPTDIDDPQAVTNFIQWPELPSDNLDTPKRSRTDSSVQTELSSDDFEQLLLPKDVVKPIPLRPTPLTSDLYLISELLQIERDVFGQRDPTNDVVELKPFGRLSIKFETAFHNPELVSRRYPLDFSGQKVLDPVSFVCGWRRSFTNFIDYIKRLPVFDRLSHEDKLSLSKRRLINIGWWTYVYQSYLNEKNGICFGNGHYHPYTTDERFPEADPIIATFSEPIMPIAMEDLIYPLRMLKADAAEFVLMKILILLRDEFYLSDEALDVIRLVREQYSKLLYNYITFKFGEDVLTAINRYTELLNLIPPVLQITSRINERIQISAFFNIIDLDPFVTDYQATDKSSSYLL